MAEKRKPGISVLIATQNEEAVVGTCLRSFLDFGDELVVVDNGSTDLTKDIVRDLAAKHPKKIKFYDKPELPDLYQNRRFAFAHSSYQWLVRSDSDYVAYTEGPYSILDLREFLLKRKRTLRPEAVAVPQSNVVGDFWHTGVAMRPGGYRANPERQHVSEAVVPPMTRFYRHFPFFAFVRRGRRETVRFRHFLKLIRWPHPVWMHCNIKSDMNHFFRSERPDWRQLADFERYPTLDKYIESIVEEKYGTTDLDEAARLYMERHVLPYLEPYDAEKYYPYPALLLEQMEQNPVYRIKDVDGRKVREHYGVQCAAVNA
jgi:glycosyltransferase involved in cell wall biosynthesis